MVRDLCLSSLLHCINVFFSVGVHGFLCLLFSSRVKMECKRSILSLQEWSDAKNASLTLPCSFSTNTSIQDFNKPVYLLKILLSVMASFESDSVCIVLDACDRRTPLSHVSPPLCCIEEEEHSRDYHTTDIATGEGGYMLKASHNIHFNLRSLATHLTQN